MNIIGTGLILLLIVTGAMTLVATFATGYNVLAVGNYLICALIGGEPTFDVLDVDHYRIILEVAGVCWALCWVISLFA